MQQTYSKEGFEKQKRVLQAKEIEYQEIRAERKVAHDLSGDGWHDNPHFNRLQQLEASKNKEIKELKADLESAKVIDFSSYLRPTDSIGLGTFVRIEVYYPEYDTTALYTWEIVCWGETDVNNGKLAYNTPLAQAILGLQINEETESILPKGKAYIEIIDISNVPI